MIGQFLSDGAHEGAFLFVPVAAAAEDDDELPSLHFIESGEHLAEGVGCVGVVNVGISYRLETAPNLGEGGEGSGESVERVA